MDKQEALKLWNKEIGQKEYSYDFAGRKIKRSDYLEKNQVGWVVSFVKPLELGGPNDEGNIIILNHNTAYEKGMNYPEFEIVGIKYRACYDEKGDFYYIQKRDDFGEF